MIALRMHDDDSDPISRALRPPPNETPEQAEERIAITRAARLVSREIDERILEDRKELERRRNAIKVLLLGQAESGKSTTLRNFQLTFCPSQFRAEFAVWKTVIQLNIIRSIKSILDALHAELELTPSSPPTSPVPSGGAGGNGGGGGPHRSPRLNNAQPAVGTSGGTHPASPSPSPSSRLTDAHRRLCKRLSPLLSIEATLTRKLLSIPEFAPVPSSLYPFSGDPSGSSDRQQQQKLAIDTAMAQRALTVRAGSGWKRILQLATRAPECNGNGNGAGTSPRRPPTADRNRDDPTGALAACRQDIVSLWRDPVLREVLRERDVRPENASGFFLDDVERIAVLNYEPTPDDILRARIRTLGVEEHHFAVENRTAISDTQKDWYIYDVGGSRSMRERWPPFFEDVDAIIFLAPLTFNQYLEEAPDVNRVKDSLQLWQQVCNNKLLARTALILFLNKTDVLARILEEGVQLKDFIPRYNKSNELKPVIAYFRSLFIEYYQRALEKAKEDPQQRALAKGRGDTQTRAFYVHETSVTDAAATRKILDGVQESILRVNLGHVNII